MVGNMTVCDESKRHTHISRICLRIGMGLQSSGKPWQPGFGMAVAYRYPPVNGGRHNGR